MTTMQQIPDGTTYPERLGNENFDALSHVALFAKRHAVTSGLTWGYYGGFYSSTTIADGTVTLTNTATNYVVVARSTGVVSVSTSTTNWNDTAIYGRLYKLTVAGGVVTAEEDHRFGSTGILATPGAIAASGVTVADAGGYFTASDSEAVLQEIGASLGGAAAIPVTTYTADLSATADADPGAGKLRFNNATPTSSTQLFIDDATADGVDLSTYFASLGASGFIKVMAAADEWQLWKWTATPTDGTGYWKFTVALQASKGTVDDTDALKVLFDDSPAQDVAALKVAAIGVFLAGKPSNAQLLLSHTAVIPFRLPASATGSDGDAKVAATADADYEIKKNGSAVCTARFATAGTTAAFTAASDTDFAAGDVLDIYAPATADATLADVNITLKVTRL